MVDQWLSKQLTQTWGWWKSTPKPIEKQRSILGVRCIQGDVYVHSTPYSFILIHFFPSSNILGSHGRSSGLFNYKECEHSLGTPDKGSLCIDSDLKDKFPRNSLHTHLCTNEGQTDFTATYRGLFFLRVKSLSDMEQNFSAKTTKDPIHLEEKTLTTHDKFREQM